MTSKFFFSVKQTFRDLLTIVRSPKESVKILYDISLYRNAVYLMMNSTVLGLTGFFFWIAAARLYSAEDVGLASAAIAAMLLLSEVSMLGLDYAIVRYIAQAGENGKNIINSSFTITGITSILLSLIFVAGINIWSPALHPIREQVWFFLAFIFFTAANNINFLAQRVCTAKRRSSFALTIGMIFGLLRFIPLGILALFSLSLGIFVSWGMAILVSTLVGILFLIPRIEPRYRPSLTIRKDLLAPMINFAIGNFVAHVSLTITGFTLPLIVINVLGSEQNAYFYIAWTFSNILFSVLGAININLFAEGSNDPQSLKNYVQKSLKLMSLLVIPAIALTLLVGDKFLLAFGEDYSRNATHLLWLLILSAIPAGINYMYIAVMRVGKEIKGIIIITVFVATVTLGSSPFMLSRMGLTGVGVAWLVSQGIVAIFTGRQIIRIVSEASTVPD